ncbi:hypothetical protein NDU88_006886 [Pleurodeles waltl]|uniref:Uncharacterized protein n=1 Tax=Pleurodeles waltl TaxID=8319 RepID=A0AAV7NWF2_PLEWA|nr:hypothetical protein NDU88_006886 [Pleurodeles waltl]
MQDQKRACTLDCGSAPATSCVLPGVSGGDDKSDPTESAKIEGEEVWGTPGDEEVVWEAQLACLRRKIIRYIKGHRKKSRQKIRDLDGPVLDLEGCLTSPPQDCLLRDLTHIQTLLRQELTQEARGA